MSSGLQRDSCEPTAPARPVSYTVTASPRLHIHGTRAREAPDDGWQNPLYNVRVEPHQNRSNVIQYPERLPEITQSSPITMAVWEHQCAFYEELWAEMKAEWAEMKASQSAIRQDLVDQTAIRQDLAEIKRELQNQRGNRNQVETHVNMQPLMECVKTEVRDALEKTDASIHKGIGSVLDSLKKVEASIRKIDVKPEVNLAGMELKSETSSKKILDALHSIDVKLKKNVDLLPVLETINANQAKNVDLLPVLETIKANQAKNVDLLPVLETIKANQAKNVDLLPVLETIKANQANTHFTVDMPPQANLSCVIEAIDKLDKSIACVSRKQTDCAAMQGTIARIESAVGKMADSKFRIDVTPLVDLKPLMDATERIDRHTMDIADEVAKIAATQLDQKFAIEVKPQVERRAGESYDTLYDRRTYEVKPRVDRRTHTMTLSLGDFMSQSGR